MILQLWEGEYRKTPPVAFKDAPTSEFTLSTYNQIPWSMSGDSLWPIEPKHYFILFRSYFSVDVLRWFTKDLGRTWRPSLSFLSDACCSSVSFLSWRTCKKHKESDSVGNRSVHSRLSHRYRLMRIWYQCKAQKLDGSSTDTGNVHRSLSYFCIAFVSVLTKEEKAEKFVFSCLIKDIKILAPAQWTENVTLRSISVLYTPDSLHTFICAIYLLFWTSSVTKEIQVLL